jgi:hypothetical protein
MNKNCLNCDRTFTVDKHGWKVTKFCPECRPIIKALYTIANAQHCKDCGKLLCDKYRERCKSCTQKGKNNSGYVGIGNRLQDKKYFCQDCKIEISYKTALYGEGKCFNCTMKERGKYQRGEHHPNYIPNLIRIHPLEFSDKLKELIRDRDNHTCQNPKCNCSEKENGKALDVHHIDYDKDNCNEENLISLCMKCHRRTNFNREYWKMLFKNLIQNLYCIIRKRG